MIIQVSAVPDKETKNTNRYIIIKNDKGVSGSIYFDKKIIENKPEKIQLKIRLGEE